MFSPVKVIIAGAVVFALGAAFLVAQPFGQQGSVPGAEQAAGLAPPAYGVKVIITEQKELGPEECTTDEDGYETCTSASSAQFSATDPRLSGTATWWVNEHTWPVRGGIFEAYAVELVNDEGRWVGTGRSIATSGVNMNMVTLTGERAYEGLSAILIWEWDPDITKAVIVDGGLPPFPELPAE